MAQPGAVWARNFVGFERETPKFPLFHGVGEGVGAEGSTVAGATKPVFRAAAAPKLLEMAIPIPNWSNVMGPIDSAM